MNRIKAILRTWLLVALLATAFCGLVYAAVQQALRQGANDPQIQMAEDAAAALQAGQAVESVVPPGEVIIESSLAPFLVIYDLNGQPVAGSGLLHGSLAQVPVGSLDYARQHGENRVTWQPETGVRIAAVIVPYDDGYVMAGRSLREVEKRVDQLTTFTGITWALSLALGLVLAILGETALGEKKARGS